MFGPDGSIIAFSSGDVFVRDLVAGETTLVSVKDRYRWPWRRLDDLEYAALEWVDWLDHRRLFHELCRIPPAEDEANHYRQTDSHHPVPTHTTEPA